MEWLFNEAHRITQHAAQLLTLVEELEFKHAQPTLAENMTFKPDALKQAIQDIALVWQPQQP